MEKLAVVTYYINYSKHNISFKSSSVSEVVTYYINYSKHNLFDRVVSQETLLLTVKIIQNTTGIC